MRITIEIDTEEMTDTDDAKAALSYRELMSIPYTHDQWLRNQLKYGHEFKTPDEALQAARDHLNEEVASQGVDFIML